jgi:hypothetical protein
MEILGIDLASWIELAETPLTLSQCERMRTGPLGRPCPKTRCLKINCRFCMDAFCWYLSRMQTRNGFCRVLPILWQVMEGLRVPLDVRRMVYAAYCRVESPCHL